MVQIDISDLTAEQQEIILIATAICRTQNVVDVFGTTFLPFITVYLGFIDTIAQIVKNNPDIDWVKIKELGESQTQLNTDEKVQL